MRSPGSGSPDGILLPESRNDWEGSTSRDGGGLASGRGCVVGRIELVNKMGPGVTPSRCADRASFEGDIDISEDLGEDVGCATTFRVLSTSAEGCRGGS